MPAVALALCGAGCMSWSLTYTPADAQTGNLAYPFHVIAHRGGAGLAPENTLPAFRRSLEMGVIEVELDVQLSRDDRVVLFHDRTLDEKTDLSGAVGDLTAAEIGAAEIGSWFDREHPDADETFAGTRLVSLHELFRELGEQPFYHIEIKGDEEALPALVLEAVAEFGLERRVMLTSFSLPQLERVRALDAEVPVSLLIDRREKLLGDDAEEGVPEDVALLDAQWSLVSAAAKAGFQQVAIAAHDLSATIVSHARSHGLEIRAWRIRSRDDMERAIRAGANGMTMDRPDWLIGRLVEEMAGRARPSRERAGSSADR